MPFRAIFIAVVIGVALVVAAFLVNQRRPRVETEQPQPALVKATGKCASCHLRETSAVVREYEWSHHATSGVTCLDCHQPVEGQEKKDHRGFTIAQRLTSKNCAQCHKTEYDQYVRSRHAAPSWAAVNGAKDMSPEQRAMGESFHRGWVERPPMEIGLLEGESAMVTGCNACHSIGRPNADGSFGTCTNCHGRHVASIEVAREPPTCGQCHMGPDHSQIEIYEESKHGVLFAAQRGRFDLTVPPKELTTAAMPVPTCSTCHMSGLEGMKMTHDTTERLSYFLFAPISEPRPNGERARIEMKEVCQKCHAHSHVDRVYEEADRVLVDTNTKVRAGLDVVKKLREQGLLTPQPFDEPIEFTEFDLWHYYGRTAKHGAYMGGADMVQWHGNYELLRHDVLINSDAAEIRARRGKR